MATIPKTTCHHRSVSLPSTSHPLVVNVEDHLCRLRASEATSTASSIYTTLHGLANLYKSVNDMLQLPLTQQTLSNERNEKWAEVVLNGSLQLLDVCGTTKDVLMQMKESVQELQSSLRRRSAGSDLANAYIISKKNINKMVSKCIKNLMNFEKSSPSTLFDKDSYFVAVVSVLREVETFSLSTMKSVLCYISRTKNRSNKKGWSLISNIMQAKHVSSKTEEEIKHCELDRVYSLLSTINKQKSTKDTELVRTMIKQLQICELAMHDLDEVLESVFKGLMKTRVSILNMLNG